jgi:hypothetical protein
MLRAKRNVYWRRVGDAVGTVLQLAFGWEDLKERDHLEDLGIDGRMLKLLFEISWEDVD